MADGNHVPVTVQGTFAYAGPYVAIGSKGYVPSNINVTNAFWFLVVDLSNLQLVANEVSTDPSTVPPDVLQNVGNGQYLLIVTSLVLRTDNVPQGPLYEMLQTVGSGYQLARAEQINEQLGTGTISNMSYILAATMAEGDGKGFEEFDFNNMTVLTFELMPVTIDGQTVYTPIQTGT